MSVRFQHSTCMPAKRPSSAPYAAFIFFLGVWSMANLPTSEAQCQNCTVAFCNNMVIQLGPNSGTCTEINQGNLLQSFAKPENSCKDFIRQTLCYVVYQQSIYLLAQNNSCVTRAPDLCAADCTNMENCLRSLQICVSILPVGQPGNCMAHNRTAAAALFPAGSATCPILPQETPAIPCADPDDGLPAEPLKTILELGGVADARNAELAAGRTFPEVTKVKKNDIKFSVLFPESCLDFRVFKEPILIGGIIWFVIQAIGLIAFNYRRNMLPIKERNLFLVNSSVILGAMSLTAYFHSVVYGTTSSCHWGLAAGFLTFTLYCWCYVLRALHLLFLYRWGEAKLKGNSNKEDWYYKHRHWLTAKYSILAFFLTALSGTILYLVFVFDRPDVFVNTPSILETGRCEWYHLTPEVRAATEAAGFCVDPTLYHFDADGALWTVALETCQFCQTDFGLAAAFLLYNYTFLILCIVTLIIVRNINDQYFIWRELVFSLIAEVILGPIATSTAFQNARDALFTGGVRINDLSLFLIVAIGYVCTVLWPLYLTFSWERDRTESRMRSVSSAKMQELLAKKPLLRLALPKALKATSSSDNPDGMEPLTPTSPDDAENNNNNEAETGELTKKDEGTNFGTSSGTGSPAAATGTATTDVKLDLSSVMNDPKDNGAKKTKHQRRQISGAELKLAFQVDMDQALADPKILDDFKKLCVEMFVVESILFYCESLAYQKVEPAQWFAEGKRIYHKFIEAGAPLEINIPAAQRDALEKTFEGKEPNPQLPAMNGQEYAGAHREVRGLLAYGPWVRFEHSPKWMDILVYILENKPTLLKPKRLFADSPSNPTMSLVQLQDIKGTPKGTPKSTPKSSSANPASPSGNGSASSPAALPAISTTATQVSAPAPSAFDMLAQGQDGKQQQHQRQPSSNAQPQQQQQQEQQPVEAQPQASAQQPAAPTNPTPFD